MKNKISYVIVMLVALMALSGSAFAHGPDKGNAAGHHHNHMCKAGDREVFKKMHELHEKLHAVLVAPKFDKKAFLSLSAQMEQLHSQMARRHAEAFASIAAKLSPAEREKMVNGFHENEQGRWMYHVGWSHSGRSQNNQTNDWIPPSGR